MTDLLSIFDFYTAWQQHFGCSIHPFAARLLAPAQRVWLKPYDDEDTLWCVSEDSLSFVVGFVLTRTEAGLTWNVQLPSNIFIRVPLPCTHFWVHQHTPPGSDRTSVYARYDATSEPELFCVLEIVFGSGEFQGLVMAAAFFGGKERE